MKKILSVIICLIVIMTLVSCRQSNPKSVVWPNGDSYYFVSETEDGVISYSSEDNKQLIITPERYDTYIVELGDDLYNIEYSNNKIRITYPNGETSWWETHENGGYGGGRVEGYPDADDLLEFMKMVESGSSKGVNINGKQVLLALILFVLGIINLAAPELSWQLSYGWRYKNAEPSDLALSIGRVSGVVAMFFALIMMASSCSS